MIFATVGTHQQPFDRLIDAVDRLASEDLVVQYGRASPPIRCLRAIPFMPFGEMLEHFDAADAVVTHAGVGSVLCATRAGHTPIVVPRLKRFGEHVDDHQEELARALGSRGAVVPLWNTDRLEAVLESLPPRRPTRPLGPGGGIDGQFCRALSAALRGEGGSARA